MNLEANPIAQELINENNDLKVANQSWKDEQTKNIGTINGLEEHVSYLHDKYGGMITKLKKKIAILEKDNEELGNMNEELNEALLTIQDATEWDEGDFTCSTCIRVNQITHEVL